MSTPHRPRQTSGYPQATLRFTPTLRDETWARERDARFAQFLAQRLAQVEATGCLAERKLAAGMLDLYTEWNQKRELAAATEKDFFNGQVSAIGWALRCLAHSAWWNTPGWESAFHPAATAPVSPTASRGGNVQAWQP
ncbi:MULTISPECIES: hypothetical protein [Streptomyces]|uniref:Uncharacterized protein n=1 Tax=Streptomyces akebiae TaxID=2865673 RepID=A0ABX8XJX8_9ACTN|nr:MULTISPECIES: hypothetical protein [Streptomyces]MCX5173386.1 hypothetical protein [Streptomyces antibioticus]MCX5173763.1 hypothetical protein [Streptomyces antibioticus]QYX76074.1 hypothetical protein K1J60_05765 [Streptomyces akebiae]